MMHMDFNEGGARRNMLLEDDGMLRTDDVLRLAEQLRTDALASTKPNPKKAERAVRDQCEQEPPARPEPSASSLARRFAPDRVMTGRLGKCLEAQKETEGPAWLAARPILASLGAIAFAPAAALSAMVWLGGYEGLSLDRLFSEAGIVQTHPPSVEASAAYAIPILPPKGAPARETDLRLRANYEKAKTAHAVSEAPMDIAAFAFRSGEAGRIDALMRLGRKMIDVGYITGARAYYRRAAEAGSGEAALAMGATFEADIIARLGAQGIKPDPVQAANWYARAGSFGINDRKAELRALTANWGSETASSEKTIMAEAPPERAKAVTPKPVRNPNAPAAGSDAMTARAEPERLAANTTMDAFAVKPRLLGSDAPQKQQKQGPLSRFMRAAAGFSAGEEWLEVIRPVNIRKEPNSDAGTYKVAQKGTKLRVLGREGNWVHIAEPKSSLEGYIYRRFLAETSAP